MLKPPPQIAAFQANRFGLALLCLLPSVAVAAEPIQYHVDLRATEAHMVRVAMKVPGANAGTELQIPAWNCLYQIRDFERNVADVKGECDGQPVGLERVDLNTWRGPNQSCGDFTVRYAVYTNEAGPFDSELSPHHAFLNLATVLFYLPRERSRAAHVAFEVPEGWRVATFLPGDGPEFSAADYDALVDSPVEAGHFEDFSYPQSLLPAGAPPEQVKHATVRLIIDADRSDYSPGRIMGSVQKITDEEVRLMQDLPFDRYTFIFHFPHAGGSGGGMEHREGTAIGVAASALRESNDSLEGVVAHEFFHLWNVKRIRPQALEPIDYIHGNDTSDLWLCEGVTNTYAQLALLRADLIDRQKFYDRVASAIESLETRSARGFQSAEMSGREAWLEKYPDYNRAARSISYYNKGELLGYLLDLGMRHASHNRAGLDDLMRRLNQDFARRGRYYTIADVSAIVGELAPAFDIQEFLADDVRSTQELDYATYLGYAGLQFATHTTDFPEPGFSVERNAGGLPQVDSIDSESAAEQAGLLVGDVLVMANGDALPVATDSGLPFWRPGQQLDLQILRHGETRVLKFRIGASQDVSFQITEDPQASPEQLRVRDGWLTGVTDSVPGKP